MPSTPTLPMKAALADSLLAEGLEAFISGLRGRAVSWDSIARELYVRTGHRVAVTGMTVQNWAARFEVAS